MRGSAPDASWLGRRGSNSPEDSERVLVPADSACVEETEFWDALFGEMRGPYGELNEGSVRLTARSAAWWADTTPGNLRMAVNRGNLTKRDRRGFRLSDVRSFRDGDVESLEMSWAEMAKAEQARIDAVQAEYALHGDFDAYMSAMARGTNKLSDGALDLAAGMAPRAARRAAESHGKMRGKPFPTFKACDVADIAPSGYTLAELNPCSRRSREGHRNDDAEHDLSWSPKDYPKGYWDRPDGVLVG